MKPSTIYALTLTTLFGCSTTFQTTHPDNVTFPTKGTNQNNIASQKITSNVTPRTKSLSPEQQCLEEIFKSYNPQKGDGSIGQKFCQNINPTYQIGIHQISYVLEQNYTLNREIANNSLALVKYADLAQKTALMIIITGEQAEQYARIYPNSEFKYVEEINTIKEITNELIKTSKSAAAILVTNEKLYTQLQQAYITNQLSDSWVESIKLKVKESQDALEVLNINRESIQNVARTILMYKQIMDKDMTTHQHNSGMHQGEWL